MKACPLCGGEVPSCKRVDARYCSESCRSRASSRRFARRKPDAVRKHRRKQNDKTQSRILARIKSRAKIAGYEFDLTLEDIQVPATCPVLGIPIFEVKAKCNNPNAPSVDRIDPNGGYTRLNSRIISNRANLLKSNATIEELECVLADLRRLRDAGRL